MTTREQTIQFLNTSDEITPAMTSAVIEGMRTEGMSFVYALLAGVSKDRMTALNKALLSVPAYMELVETLNTEREVKDARCAKTEDGGHCLHPETDDSGDTPEPVTSCCLCWRVFDDVDAIPPALAHCRYAWTRDQWVTEKSRLIVQGRLYLDTAKNDEGAAMLLEAALIEESLAEDAGTDPNGPQREDHLHSATSCRALAYKARSKAPA